MRKRSIGKEIVAGLKEIKAWKRGAKKLRAFSVELPRAAITLRNPCNMALAPLAADAIVDTRTRHLPSTPTLPSDRERLKALSVGAQTRFDHFSSYQ